MIIDWNYETQTIEDLIWLYFTKSKLPITEELYEWIDIKKVRNKIIIDEYRELKDEHISNNELFEDLSYKFGLCVSGIRKIIGENRL